MEPLLSSIGLVKVANPTDSMLIGPILMERLTYKTAEYRIEASAFHDKLIRGTRMLSSGWLSRDS